MIVVVKFEEISNFINNLVKLRKLFFENFRLDFVFIYIVEDLLGFELFFK